MSNAKLLPQFQVNLSGKQSEIPEGGENKIYICYLYFLGLMHCERIVKVLKDC